MTLGLLLYAGMALLGAVIAFVRGEPIFVREAGDLPADGLLVSLSLGLALALVTTVSTRWLVAHFGWARTLRAQMRPFLAGATPVQLGVLALLSGTAEEIFFRGALQPWVGLVVASLAFGLMHLGPTRAFLPWTIWALVMGLCFGALVAWTGHLVGAIVAHVAINAVNLRAVADFDGSLDARTPQRAPGLVDRRKVASSEHAVGERRARASA